MKNRMADFADQQQKELAELKDGYEQRLARVEDQNKALNEVNKHTTDDIWRLEKGNRQIREKAKELEIENQELSRALATAQNRVGAAGTYVN